MCTSYIAVFSGHCVTCHGSKTEQFTHTTKYSGISCHICISETYPLGPKVLTTIILKYVLIIMVCLEEPA